MLNLQGFILLKPSLYDLIGIVTRSAWQGYKQQILIAPRDMSQILTTSDQSYQDMFYLVFEWEIQIWPKVLAKKVTMQCTKIKNHTDACYPCKIKKTNHFSPVLVTSEHKTDSF